jgi:uncharacterized delta-60 repeat protein
MKNICTFSLEKLLLICLLLQLVASCSKKNEVIDPYLRVAQQTLSLPPYTNASVDVIIESNKDWQVSVSENSWIQLSKTTGNGNDTIHVTVIKDGAKTLNPTVTLTVMAVDASLNLQSQITIEQKDVNVQLAVEKTYGGNSSDNINAIVKMPDGGLLLAGTSYSSKNGDVGGTNHGSGDGWVVRLNSHLDTVWTRLIGGSYTDDFKAATLTTDGGFALAGSTSSSHNGDVAGINNGYYDWFVVKLKSNGDTLWTRLVGGSDADFAYGIASTADGGIVVVGQIRTPTFDANARVVKFNSNGDIVWQKDFGGTGIDNASSVAITPDGSILVAGTSPGNNGGDLGTSHGGTDMWVLKLTSNGDKLWSKLYGGSADESGQSIAVTADGGCIVGGTSSSSANQDVVSVNHETGASHTSDMWIVKLNGNGDISWSNLLGATSWDNCSAIAVTPDGGCVAVGYASSVGGDIEKIQGYFDFWAVRLANNGNKLWSKTYGSTSLDFASSVVVNADNSIYVAGTIAGTSASGDVKSVYELQDGWLIKLKDY